MILGTDESAYMRVNPLHPGGAFQCGWLDGDDEYPGMSISEAEAEETAEKAAA